MDDITIMEHPWIGKFVTVTVDGEVLGGTLVGVCRDERKNIELAAVIFHHPIGDESGKIGIMITLLSDIERPNQ